MEADLVARAGFRFEQIPSAGLHGVGLKALPGNSVQMLKGIFAARKIIREFKPDALFFTGGYVAGPVAIAGRHLPILLYVPDIEPGYALNFIAKFADKIAVSVQETIKFLPEKPEKIVTGYPLRAEMKRWEKAQAVAHFGLNPELPTILFFGGSLGARAINAALIHHLETLTQRCNVLHLTGNNNLADVEALLRPMSLSHPERYKYYPYLHDDMSAAFSAADLVVSRAGASILGEYPHFGLPSILVPYPHAWNYQKTNAEYLVSRGSAVMLANQDLPEQLLSTVTGLLDEPVKLQAMREAVLALATPDAASKIARQIESMALVREEEPQS